MILLQFGFITKIFLFRKRLVQATAVDIEIKKKTLKMLEEEYALKLQYQRQELLHQEVRHKLELEILAVEKEKKECELNLLKNNIYK